MIAAAFPIDRGPEALAALCRRIGDARCVSIFPTDALLPLRENDGRDHD